jgi:hypothetical protein
MSGYLDQYGQSDARREKRWKRVVLAVAAVALLGGSAYFFARTWAEERAVHQFLAHLKAKDFAAAHAQFGCTPQKPCRDYDFAKFLEDWGDKGQYYSVSLDIEFAEPCGNQVWVTIKAKDKPELALAVDPATKEISFTPDPRCPGKWRVREFPSRFRAFLRRL